MRVTDAPLVAAVGVTCMEEVRLEMEEDGEDGEEGASWRKDSMNCWIWRLSATCDAWWEWWKTGRVWSDRRADEYRGRAWGSPSEYEVEGVPLVCSGVGEVEVDESSRTEGKWALSASTARRIAPFRM